MNFDDLIMTTLRIKKAKKTSPYIVALPRELFDVSDNVRVAYRGIPLTGVTMAYSRGDAVGNYIFRFLEGSATSETLARIIMSSLKNNSRNGYSDYAMEMPKVFGDGEILTRRERMIFEEMALAQELAIIYGGRPGNHLNRARDLANDIRLSRVRKIA